ncbi:MAG: hypothetical protein WAM11_13135 [Cyanobium sp.]
MPFPEAVTAPASGDHRHADQRDALRLQSLSWAVTAALAALLISLGMALGGGGSALAGLDAALRSGGAGFFYGLLAFHLQRVDPDDSHLQAGLVGAICGLRSLGAPLGMAEFGAALDRGGLAPSLLSAMMLAIKGWLPLWLPLIGSALVLHGAQRLIPVLRS